MKPTTTLRIGIAEDHTMVRQSLVQMLNTERNFRIVLEADNGKNLLDQLEQIRVDILLLDLEMPVLDGRQTLKALKISHPDIRVIIMTGYSDTGFEREYLREGARAFLSKSEDIGSIRHAIYAVSDLYFEPEISMSLLTRREIEILKCIVQKRTNSDIAKSLYLSTRTVENHRYNILRKTGTKKAAELLKWAQLNNIL
jgi:DNA-binding NarL/FixJ family response regulator